MKQNISVLHIDDDEVDKMMMKQAMSKAGMDYTIHNASDGIEALDKLRGTNHVEALNPLPNIILLDVNMPRMSGHEFLAEIKQDEKLRRIAVILLTTSESPEDVNTAYDGSIMAYLHKPVDFDDFIQTFKTLKAFWDMNTWPDLD
ncbi:MAG: response regulator [Bacteroidia bacterium]|nr:response regulator [Bacteroidia bacterium]